MIKSEFGSRLRDLRKQKGITQEALAAASGVGNRFLQDIEAGNKQPTITSIFKLADTLGVEPGELLDPVFHAWLAKGKPAD